MTDYITDRVPATVEDIKNMMEELISQGKSEYEVICNMEYTLAMKGDVPDVNDVKKTVDLGGYI